jgi:hypothetical protein
MKYLFSTAVLMAAFAFGAFAQEKTLTELKNEAVAAITAKDFAGALALYEQAMPLMADSPDGVVYYNAAVCAKKIEQDEKALKYYSESQKINYKGSNSCLNVALLQEKLGQDEEMVKTLIDGVAKYPGTKDVEQMKTKLVNYYLIEGSKPYNAAADILKQKYADQAELDKLVAAANVKYAEAKPFFEMAAQYGDPADERISKPLAEINSRLTAE